MCCWFAGADHINVTSVDRVLEAASRADPGHAHLGRKACPAHKRALHAGCRRTAGEVCGVLVCSQHDGDGRPVVAFAVTESTETLAQIRGIGWFRLAKVCKHLEASLCSLFLDLKFGLSLGVGHDAERKRAVKGFVIVDAHLNHKTLSVFDIVGEDPDMLAHTLQIRRDGLDDHKVGWVVDTVSPLLSRLQCGALK
jgi:hypothetical protein